MGHLLNFIPNSSDGAFAVDRDQTIITDPDRFRRGSCRFAEPDPAPADVSPRSLFASKSLNPAQRVARSIGARFLMSENRGRLQPQVHRDMLTTKEEPA